MISFDGFDEIIKQVYENKQDHVFKYWDDLAVSEKKSLLEELSKVDFQLLTLLFNKKEDVEKLEFGPAPFISLPRNEDEISEFKKAREAGIDHLKKGKVAAFVVAGGQGSRLGFNGPKGKFKTGPVSGKTLFQLHGEKIFKYSEKYSVTIPWLVMTSAVNHDETVAYFEEEKYFGIGRDNVYIFPQNMIPSLNSRGGLILETKCSIFKNPDGHGGSLTALYTSGTLEHLKDRGIETISYFQIDNPLVKIADPEFIGFHVNRGADISSKALKKAYPGEKVGVFVKFNNGRIGVVEYSDLPEEKAQLKDDQGELLYSAGSIAIHLFNREFIEKVTAGKDISLPFHTANKKIKEFSDGKEVEIDGYKFEKFVFDALPLTDKNVVFETERESEFAPVKNAQGVDSIDTAQELIMNLHRSWLEKRGISIPAGIKKIEISSLKAVEPEDIEEDLVIAGEEDVLIEK